MKIRKDFVNRIWWCIIVFATIWSSKLPGITFAGFTMYPIRIIVLIWVIGQFFILCNRKQKTIIIDRATFAIIGFLCIGMITMMWSCRFSESVTSFIVYMTSAIILFMFRKKITNEDTLKDICVAFFWNMVVMAIVAIYESFTGNYVAITYEYYLRTFNVFGTFRPIAAFYNTNNLSVFFVLCLPLSLYAYKDSKFKILPQLFITGITVFICILTGSRTGYIALLIFAALLIYNKVYLVSKKLAITGLFLLGTCIVFLAVAPTTYMNSDIASEDRWRIWIATLHNCSRYFFLGSGLGTSAFLPNSPGLPHNYLLEILCEVGIIGLFMFVLLISTTIPKRYTKRGNSNDFYFKSLFWLFLLCSICPSSMQGYYYLWAIWGVCIGYNDLYRNGYMQRAKP